MSCSIIHCQKYTHFSNRVYDINTSVHNIHEEVQSYKLEGMSGISTVHLKKGSNTFALTVRVIIAKNSEAHYMYQVRHVVKGIGSL